MKTAAIINTHMGEMVKDAENRFTCFNERKKDAFSS